MKKRLWGLISACFLLLSLAACEISIPSDQGNRTMPSEATDLEIRVARHVFDAMNRDRAANALPPYSWDEGLVRAARIHNGVMSEHGSLSHQHAGEPELSTRVSNQGVQWQACGENVAFAQLVVDGTAQQKAEELHLAMLNEVPPDDGHRRNKLSTDFQRVGISIYLDAQQRLWLTEDFAG